MTAMELRTWRWRTSPETFEVLAVCRDGIEELRLTNRSRGNVTVRTIDLGAPLGDDQDAKARELALAIAELLRRADMESTPEASPAPSPPVPPPAPAPVTAQAVAPDTKPWSIELGVTWSHRRLDGRRDAVWSRCHRAGARRSLAHRRAAPRRQKEPSRRFGGRLARWSWCGRSGGSFVRCHARRASGGRVVSGHDSESIGCVTRQPTVKSFHTTAADATAVNVTGTTTGFVALSEALCLTVDAAVGGALHSVVIREEEEAISSMRGVLIRAPSDWRDTSDEHARASTRPEPRPALRNRHSCDCALGMRRDDDYDRRSRDRARGRDRSRARPRRAFPVR